VTPSDRTRMIGDAVMAVLATAGGRGLTHRAVDRSLGWPEGTTSRYCRTRDALMTAGVSRLVDLEVAELERWEHEQMARPVTALEDVARIFRDAYSAWTGRAAQRQLARYALSLEGPNRPAVREAIICGRERINDSVSNLLATVGCKRSAAHSTAMVSYLDGLVHDQLLHPEVAVDPRNVEELSLNWLRSCCASEH
jgi:DNA-binding transcriptional regulator YbjK